MSSEQSEKLYIHEYKKVGRTFARLDIQRQTKQTKQITYRLQWDYSRKAINIVSYIYTTDNNITHFSVLFAGYISKQVKPQLHGLSLELSSANENFNDLICILVNLSAFLLIYG